MSHAVTTIASPIGIVKTAQHPYGIGSAKPIIRTPIAHLLVTLPIYHTPLVPKSVAQSPYISFFDYISHGFISDIVSYPFSVFSQSFSGLFLR
jgi:hypothetical protein